MKKYYNISLLRTLSTIIIVVFHILLALSPGDGKTYFPFYIGVPIFLFISGYLYAKRNIENTKEFYKSNILKILVPTLTFLLLTLAAVGIYSLCTQTAFLGLIQDESGSGNKVFSVGHLWFIPAIIACYLIFPLVQKMYNKECSATSTAFIIILFILLEIGCIALSTSVIIPFLAGFLVQKKQDKLSQKPHITWIVSLLLFVVFAVSYPFFFSISPSNNIAKLFYMPGKEIIVGAMGGSFASFFIFATSKLKFPVFIQKCLESFDKLSFPIYFIHHIFVFGAFDLLHITNITSINILIFIAATIVGSTSFMFLMKPICKKARRVFRCEKINVSPTQNNTKDSRQ